MLSTVGTQSCVMMIIKSHKKHFMKGIQAYGQGFSLAFITSTTLTQNCCIIFLLFHRIKKKKYIISCHIIIASVSLMILANIMRVIVYARLKLVLLKLFPFWFQFYMRPKAFVLCHEPVFPSKCHDSNRSSISNNNKSRNNTESIIRVCIHYTTS